MPRARRPPRAPPRRGVGLGPPVPRPQTPRPGRPGPAVARAAGRWRSQPSRGAGAPNRVSRDAATLCHGQRHRRVGHGSTKRRRSMTHRLLPTPDGPPVDQLTAEVPESAPPPVFLRQMVQTWTAGGPREARAERAARAARASPSGGCEADEGGGERQRRRQGRRSHAARGRHAENLSPVLGVPSNDAAPPDPGAGTPMEPRPEEDG